jgi:hypothetical protein
MTPVDLIPFANFSKKLPSFYLHPNKEKHPFENLKLFVSHIIDFYLCFGMTLFLVNTTSTQFESLLFNSKFSSPNEITSSIGFTFLIFPFFLFNYFFFSYFFNHGQTFGMHLTKKRIDQKSKSFNESLRWAAHSMTLCSSFGMSFFWQKSIWNKFRSHDYLYSDFVTYKESSPINLLEKIHEFETEKVIEESDWKKAA